MRALYRVAGLLLALFPALAGAQPRSGMMNVGDASLRYDVAGSGPRTVVLVHGWALHLGVWDSQVAAFSPTYRVVRYDLRGFARSTGDADRTADPDDLRILLDSLGIRSAHVIGLSRGAGIAADFAARWPERVQGLVLYGMGPTPDFPLPPDMRGGPPFARIAREFGMDSLRKYVAGIGLAWRPPGSPAPRVDPLAGYDGRDLLHDRPPSERVKPATIAELSQIGVPIMVLNGDHELPLLMSVADTLARRIPAAKRVVIADAGHGAHLAQPEAFNRAVLAFLAEVDRSRRSP